MKDAAYAGTGNPSAVALSIVDRLASDGLLNLEEFAAWAGICRRRVYDEINAKRLSVVKIGRRTAIRARDARKWQDSLGSEAA